MYIGYMPTAILYERLEHTWIFIYTGGPETSAALITEA